MRLILFLLQTESFLDWQTSLHNEIERLQDSISSDSTMFRLQSSSVILGRGSNYGVPEDATCDYLPACVTESEEGFSGKKKKQEKQMVDMSLVMRKPAFLHICL